MESGRGANRQRTPTTRKTTSVLSVWFQLVLKKPAGLRVRLVAGTATQKIQEKRSSPCRDLLHTGRYSKKGEDDSSEEWDWSPHIIWKSRPKRRPEKEEWKCYSFCTTIRPAGHPHNTEAYSRTDKEKKEVRSQHRLKRCWRSWNWDFRIKEKRRGSLRSFRDCQHSSSSS